MDQFMSEKGIIPSSNPPPSGSQSFLRKWFRVILLSIFTFSIILSPHILSNNIRCLHKSTNALSIEERAIKVLEKNPLIDGHNDLLILVRALYGNHIYDDPFSSLFKDGGMPAHVDVPRLKQGMQGGAFWSAFMPCPKNWTDFSDENYAPIVRATLEAIDTFHRLTPLYPHLFTPTPSAAAAHHAFAHSNLISPLAIEGLHQIGNSISTLRLYHSLGVRYATLSWNCHNRYVDAAVVSDTSTGKSHKSSPYWGGVSPAGRTLIKEMNRLGMLVDLAHVSVDTMRDVLGGSAEQKGWNGSIAPPIFSHSSAYSLCPHPRNVPDDILDLVKKRNSIVMVNFSPDFVSCVANDDASGLPTFYEKNNTLGHVVEHIMYIGDRIGYDHVGVGSDYDGIESTPRGLEDVSKFPDLVAELLKRGVSEKDAGKIVGRNLLRVWEEVDRVKEELKGMKPVEDDVKKGWEMM
ncbi:hypothetical protein K402DRAFT_353307 [Aulographum hederae CBS 113979]|uniref:Dipeptidase n=1 Tax=Aulographum hederae CBS 113979 TaxID=1176131 RepID=A0A6G1H3C7_9PEZI|nr:hypothetical protein K402DRAFT_353307 [Aulographum hederae CBS 113979]